MQSAVGEILEVMRPAFSGVIPVLPVTDVDAALEFYRSVLGFSVQGRHLDAHGVVVFGSVLCGKANFYFARSTKPFTASCCYVGADEVDGLCRSFEARGGRIVDRPEDKPWGCRQFTLEDINGHVLHFFRFSDGVR